VGPQTLVRALAARLPDDSVQSGARVLGVARRDGGFELEVSTGGTTTTVEAERLVVALPPRLVATTVEFEPGLDEDLVAVMRRTPTWMATALNGVAVYEEVFWRDAGLSGLALCDTGPLREVHDGGSADGSVAALWGFVSPHHDVRDLPTEDRIEATLEQLGSYFGSRAADPIR